MKKILFPILVFLLIPAILSGCGKKPADNPPDDSPLATQATESVPILPSAAEVEAQLRLDAYPESSQLMSLVGQFVTFSDISVGENTVSFTVSAPAFGEELIAWYDAQTYLEDGALEAEIARLLEKEPVRTQFTLSYTWQGNALLLSYTEEYLNAAGCGIRAYYNHVYTAVLEEMGVAP